ncbi:hypothetical protein NG800_012965 [Epilithonimonas ginsengisoli]|uniref:Uncharacterized protein n=1 Tax=Epilithonimonas ginsengisoli TaxID=1245592 RepID=A0ABU4JJF5_9FLAO|nr:MULTISPECIES: hypothetical protein [Chryseobacterium group]MBV6880940.1 hypothetical protein [Epilithonimonas sp. FP105]MDW8549829.1 hypothetical protein [Epilithonimonas ginsengisoli]OAH73580.1 hypothetical protein AXA65_07530 [Chryseobacterium sp. FP211-J200]
MAISFCKYLKIKSIYLLNMSNENNFKGIDISKITQNDLISAFPEFLPLLVSTTENCDDD